MESHEEFCAKESDVIKVMFVGFFNLCFLKITVIAVLKNELGKGAPEEARRPIRK